ncbi:MAG: CmcI family methyltransferase [Candidatus Dependentiae bacterium]
MKKNIFYALVILATIISHSIYADHLLKCNSKVFIHGYHDNYTQPLLNILKKFNINYEQTSMFDNNDALYIIFDAHQLNKKDFPQHYIIYQTLDLSGAYLTSDYNEKLSNAIAVWDYNSSNINHYRHLYNYYYFPANYEYADPVILPCFLPTRALDSYKQMLIYSNQKDTDISSHIPALFTYTLLLNPNLIVEAGVRGGQSTKPFYQALQLCSATMIGLDIEPSYAAAYNALKNTLFIHMDDLNFVNYYQNSDYKNTPIDLIFIDTSHLYEHTLAEIKMFVPLLNTQGIIAFHDSNVTPLPNHSFMRINGTTDSAPGNTRGVTQALKEYFALEFNEHYYVNTTFIKDGNTWHMVHYPFCNGLTFLQKRN